MKENWRRRCKEILIKKNWNVTKIYARKFDENKIILPKKTKIL